MYAHANSNLVHGLVHTLQACSVTVHAVQRIFNGWLACSQTLYYVNERYAAPDIIITENGVDVPDENAAPYSTNDPFRINYVESYLEQVETL